MQESYIFTLVVNKKEHRRCGGDKPLWGDTLHCDSVTTGCVYPFRVGGVFAGAFTPFGLAGFLAVRLPVPGGRLPMCLPVLL